MVHVERNFAGDPYAQSGYWGPQTSVAKYVFSGFDGYFQFTELA